MTKGIRRVLLNNKVVGSLMGIVIFLAMSGCKDYLDIVPDNVATLDNAFTIRNEAEKYLFTCYSYLPNNDNMGTNPAFLGGDECWFTETWVVGNVTYDSWYIGQGQQNVNDPLVNYWDGRRSGKALFQGIRSCNIFLENVSNLNKVTDLTLEERNRWLGEVKFLKAYYHFVLLRMYGPIPIIDHNLLISATPEAVRIRRMPVDTCVNYIATLLDSAAVKLPNFLPKVFTEAGRITRPIALSIKARLLLMAASPLFNGNPDYQNFKDKHGVSLFNSTYDASKWQRAADAAKIAIQASQDGGNQLYYFNDHTFKLSDTTITQMNIRNSICEKWNTETVWGNSNANGNVLQTITTGTIDPKNVNNKNGYGGKLYATMKMAEIFYTKNGVPIEEDKTLDFSEKNKLRTATVDEGFNIETGYETARINFDRENRFYADLGFDGGVWYMYDSPTGSDIKTYVMKAKANQLGNTSSYVYYCASGYFLKKFAAWETVYFPNLKFQNFPWPEVRLADLYLMYAEASNEASGPSDEILSYLDLIRKRAGLLSVKESWETYSTNPGKFTTKEGMRDIIHQERGIELAFEGSRFWDMKRWKKANLYFNQPITGWSVKESEASSYYQTTVLYRPMFIAPRDYFWPIWQDALSVNPELVQNPGW